jgi:hypothetical protein
LDRWMLMRASARLARISCSSVARRLYHKQMCICMTILDCVWLSEVTPPSHARRIRARRTQRERRCGTGRPAAGGGASARGRGILKCVKITQHSKRVSALTLRVSTLTSDKTQLSLSPRSPSRLSRLSGSGHGGDCLTCSAVSQTGVSLSSQDGKISNYQHARYI